MSIMKSENGNNLYHAELCVCAIDMDRNFYSPILIDTPLDLSKEEELNSFFEQLYPLIEDDEDWKWVTDKHVSYELIIHPLNTFKNQDQVDGFLKAGPYKLTVE